MAGPIALLAAAAARRHLRRAGLGYAGVCAGAFLSWAGVPGPGEAAVVAAGLLAGRGRLGLAAVVGAAWAGATVGGVAGWLVGLKAGRGLATAPGPALRARLAVLARGERFYERFGALAVFLTPSWVAGIHGMPARRFVPANLVAALVWALALGVGSDLAGPSVAEVVDDLGLAGVLVVGAGAVAAVLAIRRRPRRGGGPDPPTRKPGP